MQEALWGAKEIRGAAVMVGAGFSKFAELPSETGARPPLWNDFAREMLARLYPAGGGPTNPLRLAEEYEASLGRHALDGLIRSLVQDDQWQPGEMHRRLLSLPWADVLTTNWDTLLERTSAPESDIAYDVVRVVEDIARTRAPRIVKLHGSLPSHGPFIFTEEDFRTYPRRFAPLVNIAQQTLLENELCLLGFSGDDPNFLAWSGWVRDHLGKLARRIRLVGVLNLSVSQRQVLEHHNVSPIDLSPLVKDLDPSVRHRRAVEMFLDSLVEARPQPLHVWTHRTRPEQDATSKIVDPNQWALQLAAEWREERESYPGWLVAPPGERYRIRYDSGVDRREFRTNVTQANIENRARVIREWVWRCDAALLRLGTWGVEIVESVLADGAAYLSADERCDLLLALLREARRNRDVGTFEKLQSELEKSLAGARRVELTYERALRQRDDMDFESLAATVEEIEGDDPAWGIRRASLLCDLNDPERAAEILLVSLENIRRRRLRDRASIWLLSREAWAEWTMDRAWFDVPKAKRRAPRDETYQWPVKYKAANCDPWDELHHLDYEIGQVAKWRREQTVSILPRFDAGTYQDKAQTVRSRASELSPLQEVIALAEKVGLPRYTRYSDVIGTHFIRALEIEPESFEPAIRIAARSLRSRDDGLIEQYFGRVQVARLPKALLDDLVGQLKRSVDYGRKQLAGEFDAEWVSDVVRWIELLSRLSVRLAPAEALTLFRWAIELSHDPTWSHWWLFEPLEHLLTRTLEAMPRELHSDVALDVLEFPLADEKSIKGQASDWPEVSLALGAQAFAKRENSHDWTHRIAALVEHARKGSPYTRPSAVWRLLRLHEAKVLTVAEQAAFATALWSARAPNEGLPEHTDLYGHVFLVLPEPEPGIARAVFDRVIVKSLAEGAISESSLISLSEAGRARTVKNPFVLAAVDALQVLDACLQWIPRPVPDDDSFTGYMRQENRNMEWALGRCLANAVLSTLADGGLDSEREKRLAEAMANPARSTLLEAAAEFARLVPGRRQQIVSMVRRGLASGSESTVRSAVVAVVKFITAYEETKFEFPSVFATDIATMCTVRQEPGLLDALWCARRLAKAGLLPAAEQHRVIEGLEFLLTETAYENWDSNDPRTRSLSLVRQQCVRTAHAFRSLEAQFPSIAAWLAVPTGDPIPEVRYALDTVSDDG